MNNLEKETALEARCVQKVEAVGGMALKLVIPGVRGFPDRTCLMPLTGPTYDRKGPLAAYTAYQYSGPARTFFAEFKRLKTGRPSVQQLKWKRDLEALGFQVYLVDTDAQFDVILEEWR